VDRQLNVDEMKFLNKKKIDMTDSGQPVIQAVMPANVNKVEDLALSQEDKPRKQFTLEK